MKICVVDTTVCDACGTCIAVCPQCALHLTKTIIVNEQKCVVCGTCIRVCPVGALSFKDKTS